MERARKRTPIFQRSKGACIAGLAVSLSCAIFGVGGAVAGDGKYAHQVRESQVKAQLTGAALAHRTPEQLVLAITPKSQHATTPAAATPSSPGASTLTDTAAQQVPTGTTLTDTTSQPPAVTPTTGATSTPSVGANAGPADSTSSGDTGTTPADNTTTGNTGTDNRGTDNGGNGNGNGDNGNGNGNGNGDNGKGNGNGNNGNGAGGNGRPDTSGNTGTGTTTSTDHGRSASAGGATSGSTTNACHGRCTGSSQGGGVLPASLPSSNSQTNAGNFSLAVTPSASATPPPAPTPPINAVSSVGLPQTPPSTPASHTPPATRPTRLGKFPTFRSTSAIHRLSHGRTGSSQTTPLASAGGAAVAVANATTRRTAPAARTPVASAPAATSGASKTTSGTHKPPKHPSSGGVSGPAGPIIHVVHDIVKVIPTAVWIALGAAFGLALAFAGLALRAGRRARRREREFKAISAAAATDALTGILNRRGFMDAAERELARASRYDRPFVVAYVDVRGLKAVNDTEGHLVGDELIKAVAGLMKESARADDVVGRIGGDEFALLLDEQTAEGAQPVLRRIRSRVDEHRAAMEIRVPWELTIGIAAFPADGTTLEELLGTADRRLYEQRGIALR